MSNIGLKISTPGQDVATASLQNLVLSTVYAILKCDLRPNPKHYGTINFTIASVPAFDGTNPGQVPIYQIPHDYTYIPSFLTSWSFPAGTDSLSVAGNATFGIGDIDASLSTGIVISMKTDNANFSIIASNSQNAPITNTVGTIRFYIFADDFVLTTS